MPRPELPKLHPDRGLGVIWANQKFSAISKNIIILYLIEGTGL